MARVKFDLQKTIKAVESNAGLVNDIANALGVNRKTIWEWRKKNRHVDEAFTDVEESRLDLAECKLMEAIKKGDAWAICFFLKCKGKSRGYVERQEITGKDGGALQAPEEWQEKLRELKEFIMAALEPYPEARIALSGAFLKEAEHGNGISKRNGADR